MKQHFPVVPENCNPGHIMRLCEKITTEEHSVKYPTSTLNTAMVNKNRERWRACHRPGDIKKTQ